MKNLKVLIALALLAVAGTGLAVTCAYDNVPGATLLVPYFKVTRIVGTDGTLQPGGTDTLVSVTNVSGTGVIAHVTVWNKYSAPVFDFNIPMTGFDVAAFSMRDILNGNLNNANDWKMNPNATGPSWLPVPQIPDPCFTIPGWAQTDYIRFVNPDTADRLVSISQYASPAFTGLFKQKIWASLDESGDLTSLTSFGAVGGPYIDKTNPACTGGTGDTAYAGDFTGYLTIDVVNYCTNYFPAQAAYYVNDAIATRGWPTTPNVLMGDIFFVDPTAPNGGNISGDQAIAFEYDSRLAWSSPINGLTTKTFYTRYYTTLDTGAAVIGGAGFNGIGDLREPLGTTYGARYLWLNGAATNPLLRTWLTVFRSDVYEDPSYLVDLCTATTSWYQTAVASKTPANGAPGKGFQWVGTGTNPPNLGVNIAVYDNDEQLVTPAGSCATDPGPSGCPILPGGPTAGIWLESQRIQLTPAEAALIPAAKGWANGGWVRLAFSTYHHAAQAYVGVQHSGQGLAVSVGHSATLLNNQFLCTPDAVLGTAGTGNVNQ